MGDGEYATGLAHGSNVGKDGGGSHVRAEATNGEAERSYFIENYCFGNLRRLLRGTRNVRSRNWLSIPGHSIYFVPLPSNCGSSRNSRTMRAFPGRTLRSGRLGAHADIANNDRRTGRSLTPNSDSR